MVLVDRRHLFIDNHVLPGCESDARWHVSDVAAVTWSRRVFNGYWDLATPWQQAVQQVKGSVTNERQRQILRQLDAGYPQQQVGAQVGLSERAVNKELAQLRTALNLRSTYQLMSWWGRSPERDLP
ncbi:LuxR C-terminal-related transcriptional regulator [Streptomyces sp. NPDC005900]|uniref:LuxR C-terminal-related transcriptional regulator n=1 Tax=Streptomyces sp. NPDC005900 TaxID=3154569 RepID=UPI0033D184BB